MVTIKLNVTHNILKSKFIEMRFDTKMSIDEVRDKIYLMTGTSPQFQELTLIKRDKQISLSSEIRPLIDFDPEEGDTIHVVDRNPYSMLKTFDVDKADAETFYKMSDEKYDKLTNSVRAFKREKFKTDPVYREQVLRAKHEREQATIRELEAAAEIEVGSRCQVLKKKLLGTVKYLGDVEGKQGIWVGVELDEPLGTCSGDGLFQCREKYGLVLKPSDIQCGDFKEEDINLESSDEL